MQGRVGHLDGGGALTITSLPLMMVREGNIGNESVYEQSRHYRYNNDVVERILPGCSNTDCRASSQALRLYEYLQVFEQ